MSYEPSVIDLSEFDRLEETINYVHRRYAETLRTAVANFNATPISLSTLDEFRSMVLRIADGLAEPLPPRDPNPSAWTAFCGAFRP